MLSVDSAVRLSYASCKVNDFQDERDLIVSNIENHKLYYERLQRSCFHLSFFFISS